MAQDFGFKLSEIKSQIGNTNIERGLPSSVIVNAINLKREQIKSDIDKLKLIDKKLLQLQNKLEISQCKLDSTL
jgi:DNA-binding transcriptional MerR regulator